VLTFFKGKMEIFPAHSKKKAALYLSPLKKETQLAKSSKTN
jgi:hypothetical protein